MINEIFSNMVYGLQNVKKISVDMEQKCSGCRGTGKTLEFFEGEPLKQNDAVCPNCNGKKIIKTNFELTVTNK